MESDHGLTRLLPRFAVEGTFFSVHVEAAVSCRSRAERQVSFESLQFKQKVPSPAKVEEGQGGGKAAARKTHGRAGQGNACLPVMTMIFPTALEIDEEPLQGDSARRHYSWSRCLIPGRCLTPSAALTSAAPPSSCRHRFLRDRGTSAGRHPDCASSPQGPCPRPKSACTAG